MKLLTKSNFYISITTALLFTLGVFVIYQVIKSKLDKDVDTQLLSAKAKVIKGLKQGIPPKEFLSNIGQKIYIKEIYKQTVYGNHFVEYIENKMGDPDAPGQDSKIVTQRELLFHTSINDKAYEVTICISLSEGKKMGEYIIGVVLIFLVASFVFLFLLNRYISAFIWSPFYDTLSKIKTWNIKKNEEIIFKNNDIDEFHLLNDTVKDLTQQIQLDYYNLKEFTENVSHEAQTPLSIISTKLELLLQESNYSEKQHEHLLQAYRATQRMYKLNEALILLTRIENKQFIDKTEIDLVDAMNEKLEVLSDFVEAKNILIEKEYKKEIKKEVNSVLLTILLNNLFINAIKYNLDDGGSIKIIIEENTFSVENASAIDKIDKQFIFERFNKTSTSGSLGVGLSLIKKVVDFFNWQITYSHHNGMHKFKIYM